LYLHLKEKFEEHFFVGLYLFFTNLIIISLFHFTNITLYKNILSFSNMLFTMLCIFFTYKDLKELISKSSKLSHLNKLLDLTILFLFITCFFNSILLNSHHLLIKNISFVLSCMMPLYVFFVFLSFHLFYRYHKFHIFSLTVYFSSLVLYGLFSAIFLIPSIANLFFSLSYLSLSFVFLDFFKLQH
jgi:hypothetical protein